jgi:hypothetical protein
MRPNASNAPARSNISAPDERRDAPVAVTPGVAPDACSYVGGESDDLERLAVWPQDRMVGRLEPDLPAMLADMAVLSGLEFTPLQAVPESLIGHAVAFLRGNENRVGSSADVGEAVSRDRKEILVGNQDRTIHLERDDGMGAIQGGEGRRGFVGLRHKHQHASPS